LVGLLEPLEVKGLLLKNRIVMPPMYSGLAGFDGVVTDEVIKHYVQRSKALGLLVVEHTFVVVAGKMAERQLGIYDNRLIAGLEGLSSRVHATGTPVVIQLNHAGRRANKELTSIDPVAPSANETARELRGEEIEDLIDAFSMAAERAMKAGFDGVEVHGAHGFLINQFFSPLTNQRRDRYGGSLENRMRFPLEVVERVVEKVKGRLLLYRLGADDLDLARIQLEDSKKLAVKLEEVGVDIIDVSGGLCGSRARAAQLQGKQGFFVHQAQRIKKVVNGPIIGVGGIREPEYADSLIREGMVDLVAVGRALLEDSEWAVKAVRKLEAAHSE